MTKNASLHRSSSEQGKGQSTRSGLLLCSILAAFYLLLAPFPSRLFASLFGSPAQPIQRTVNVAIYDSFHEHYEIIGPLIYTLSRIPNIQLSVYRNYWRYQYPDLLQPYFSGPFYQTRQFWQAPENATHAGNVDVLFLPNADLDLRTMLQSRIDQHPNLRSARIVAGVHRTEQWEAVIAGASKRPDGRPIEWTNSMEGQTILRSAVRRRKLSFMAYNPHVTHRLKETLRSNGLGSKATVHTFVPVLPNITGSSSDVSKGGECQRVVIQGSFNGDRDYKRIFEDLEQAIRDAPKIWGYELLPANGGQPGRLVDSGVKVGGQATGFQLHLLGHIKHFDKADSGSAFLEPVVRVHPNLQYRDYYRTISEMDLLLPAWLPDTPYTESRSSSSVPAAIMSRIQALLSDEEAKAYAYAAPPALLGRRDGESEIQAIRRLRMSKGCKRAGVEEWEEFESALVEFNERTLESLSR